MIIGCTGNYRKKEYFTILEKIFKLVSDSNTKFLQEALAKLCLAGKVP